MHSTSTSTSQEPGWALSAAGQSCTDACGLRGCSRSRIDFADSDFELSELATLLNTTCNNFVYSSLPSAPYIDDEGTCYFSDPGTATCGAQAPFQRWCCCSFDGTNDCPLESPPPGWRVASPGETCDTACGETGCDADARSEIRNGVQFSLTLNESLALTEDCLNVFEVMDPLAPYFDGEGNCYVPATNMTSTCTSANLNRQLCCCQNSTQDACPVRRWEGGWGVEAMGWVGLDGGDQRLGKKGVARRCATTSKIAFL